MTTIDILLGLALLHATGIAMVTRNAPRELVSLSERSTLSPARLVRGACGCAVSAAILAWPVGISLVLAWRIVPFARSLMIARRGREPRVVLALARVHRVRPGAC